MKSRYDLVKAIKAAKRQNNGHDVRRMWQGLQSITDYKVKSQGITNAAADLPDELNTFDAPYEVTLALQTASEHLDKRNTYIRMLFVDYNSAFNTIIPSQLVMKLQALGLCNSMCNLILDFLTGRPQVVKVGNAISSPLILNTGTSQGCVSSPLLYSLNTHDCTAKCNTNCQLNMLMIPL